MLRSTRLLIGAGIVLLFVTQLSFRGSRSVPAAEATRPLDLSNAARKPAAAAASPASATSPRARVAPTRGAAACAGGTTGLFSELDLNGAARDLWGCIDRSRVQAVMLTFGSKSMSDFLLNWVEHVRRLGTEAGPYLVGALDAPMAELCRQRGIAAATVPQRTLEARGLGEHSRQLGGWHHTTDTPQPF